MITPDWFLLMLKWRSSGLRTEGITLPFLVGALRMSRRDPNLTSQEVINQLITEAVDDYAVKVDWCHGIDAAVLVATPIESLYKNADREALRELSRTMGRVFFTDGLQAHWVLNDEGSLVEKLISDAEPYIGEHKYSRQEEGYTSFTAAELSFIGETIMTPPQ